jgi:hypothetical protein
MEEQEAKRMLFARFLYSWILISIAFFILWSTSMINTKLYSVLCILTTFIMIVWLMKIISM